MPPPRVPVRGGGANELRVVVHRSRDAGGGGSAGDPEERMRRMGDPDPAKKYTDFSRVPHAPRHKGAPLWVLPNGDIYLEAYSPFYIKAKEFLQQCAEPKSRPQFIHK